MQLLELWMETKSIRETPNAPPPGEAAEDLLLQSKDSITRLSSKSRGEPQGRGYISDY